MSPLQGGKASVMACKWFCVSSLYFDWQGMSSLQQSTRVMVSLLYAILL